MNNTDPINYKREAAYQVMRTIRAVCFPIFILAMFFGGIYLINAFMNSLQYMQLLMRWLVDMPMPTTMSTMFSDKMTMAEFHVAVLKQMIYTVIGFGVAIVAHASFIPYNTQSNMPTYKIRHCQGCGAALANHNIYSCHSCGCKLPSGFGLAAIRSYGYFLTYATFGLMVVLVLILL